MILQNYYYVYSKGVSKKDCEKILELGKSLKKKDAEVYKDFSTNASLNNNLRNCNVSFLSDNWIYEIINPFINEANKKAKWNYDIDWVEPCQFTEYNPGQHYDYHCDAIATPYEMNDKNFNGKIRKLSCTLLLNDPNDYDGGQFEFDYRNTNQSNKKQVNELNQIGSILIFPSFVWHKVFPITKGVRYSLVAWYLGLPFR